MTIKEALTSTVNFPLPDNRINKALIDAELVGTSDYDKSNERSVDLCMSGLLLTLITSADTTEDDVSIKLPSRDVLLSVYSALRKKWGEVDELAPVKPTVTQRLFW
ncbi:DUF6706 family protein [Pedobacter punctiformis]|uniref:Uncharacterized protein n=1 Tax=Pedobacter punctiformis TaxID=3004097 RepID=A0ABT4LAP2_9SPHI|nr:DUF6706 family protein [Pedobacter sp. HCMS5-2]MCZ4244975.1 hypothetical protein [Pedobacter sp. HCMS5-2]